MLYFLKIAIAIKWNLTAGSEDSGGDEGSDALCNA